MFGVYSVGKTQSEEFDWVSEFVRHTLDLRPTRCKRRTGSHIHRVLFSQQFSLKEIQIKSLFPFPS